MKTIRRTVENDGRHEAEARAMRSGCALSHTDYHYNAATLAAVRSRCVAAKTGVRSFRKISDDYFHYEAPQSFVAEAAVFGLIVLTTALPLFDGASALVYFLRAIGAA